MTLTREQVSILDHTLRRASVPGHYCGGGPDMDVLVAAGLMESAGRVSWVPDEYFRIRPAGKAFLRTAEARQILEGAL